MTDQPMSEQERLAAASWSLLVEHPDPVAGALVAQLGPAEALDWVQHVLDGRIDAGHPRWRQAVDRWAPRLETLEIRRQLEVLQRLGGELVVPGDTQWPTALDDFGFEAPHALWVRGRLSRAPGLAVVGARSATSYGQRQAADLAAGAAERGLAVISGGAYGIDAAAHRGALAVDGDTVAVLAGGPDRLYPAGNTRLLEQIIDTGAVISEYPPGAAPTKHRFLARNRLIAALGLATVVVEAAWRSGALSTAAHAAGLSRPVGAVPGPVTSAASAGCHRLMREQHAVCVTDAAEAVELCGPISASAPRELDNPPSLLDGLAPLESRVLDAMPARGAADTAKLARVAGVAPAEVRSALGRLELAERVERHGSQWRRAR